MNRSLQDVSGIGDSIASDLRSRFGDTVRDAGVEALSDVPYVSQAKALHLKGCMCENNEPETVIDETEPRLGSRGDQSEQRITSIQEQLSHRATGRTTDTKKLIRHSLGATTLRINSYQQAINEHKACIRTAIENPYPFSQVNDDDSDESSAQNGHNGMSSRVWRQLKDEVPNFIRLFLSTEGPFSTKLDAIIAVRLTFDPVLAKPLPGYMVADTIGCSSGYATDFEAVEIHGEQVILRKEHAARRQVQKTEDWQRKAVLNRDGHVCLRCGETDDLIIHHIVPVSQGGTDDLENLVTLCKDCHADAHPDAVDTPEVVYDSSEFEEWLTH